MIGIALGLIAAPLLCFGYAYVVYPAILALRSARRPPIPVWPDPPEWPAISITVPAYNEERSIAATLDALLAVDYPPDRRQIVVVSDASTDRTDEIVTAYANRGVELLRMPERRGKSAAESAVAAVCRGEILVNTDASIRIRSDSLKALVRVFQDPTIGVASGRDLSVGKETAEGNRAESGYVGYEMWVRGMETRLGSIVGASGCFYGIRKHLHDTRFPEALSRDFACALIAHEHGYRAVSVDAAVAMVPRTASLAAEFRRKIRTMARGIHTLWYKRHLLNPFRHGWFAVMLFSHKLCRWLVYLLLPAAVVGLVLLSTRSRAAAAVLALGLAAGALGTVGLRWPSGRRVPPLFALPGFILASNVAGMLAWLKVLRGEQSAMWEPTRR
jgi:cellulose synthase/poly-beta-1,6-N-acetylglucosamine synthase-like glycosyltransferase